MFFRTKRSGDVLQMKRIELHILMITPVFVTLLFAIAIQSMLRDSIFLGVVMGCLALTHLWLMVREYRSFTKLEPAKNPREKEDNHENVA